MNVLVKLILVFGFFGLLIFAVISSNVLQRYSYDIYACKNASLPTIELRFNEIKTGQMAEFKQANDAKTLRITENLDDVVSLEADDLSLKLDRNTNRLYQEINDLLSIFRCEINSFTM